MPLTYRTLSSPVGPWTVEGSDDAVTRVFMPGERAPAPTRRVGAAVADAARQLDEYLRGRRRDFAVNLADAPATDFQREVWHALSTLPFGTVATYAEVASLVGRPRAARAVGNANHANPWPGFIPCHRVVASTGLGGYGGGPVVKRFLLRLEGVGAYA